ncbi:MULTISPECIES: DUF896 domain-containing protein [Fusobacterium]|uniref:DUF896 domain-containing protein n=1 Tax=Fusobacterium TaxID=848 RepID=UPI0010328749|nr:DUF896 domain-containing protein [Fusobacterium ulcerans]
MEMNKIIEKINYFTRLSRERELTSEEKKDRELFRKMYMEQFRAQVKGHLDNITIVDGEVENSTKII